MIALLLGVALAADPPVTVHGRAIPDTTTLGSHVRYEVEVVSDPDVEVVLGQPTERLGPFDIVDFGQATTTMRDGKRVTVRWFTLVGWEVGHHLVPTPPVAYRVAGEELATAPGDEARISIESLVEAAESADIRDIAPPEPIPVDWRLPALVAGLVAVLAGLLGLAWWFVRGRTAAAPGQREPAPHERAEHALAVLAAGRQLERGAFKEYYAELSGIVRRYLEDRFGVRAPEMTTEEFLMATARGDALRPDHRALLGEFLAESDLVKFARHRPTIEAAERALAAARRFVADTRPPEVDAA